MDVHQFCSDLELGELEGRYWEMFACSDLLQSLKTLVLFPPIVGVAWTKKRPRDLDLQYDCKYVYIYIYGIYDIIFCKRSLLFYTCAYNMVSACFTFQTPTFFYFQNRELLSLPPKSWSEATTAWTWVTTQPSMVLGDSSDDLRRFWRA